MMMDGSKEQTLGKFCCKLEDVYCQMKHTKPYSPWKNVFERDIQEFKMMQTKDAYYGITQTPLGTLPGSGSVHTFAQYY